MPADSKETEKYLRETFGSAAPVLFGFLSKEVRRGIPALDQEAKPNIISSASGEVQYTGIASLLKNVMFAHGFTLEQQIGLLLLLKINAIVLPPEFKDEKAANDWLKNSTQKLIRKGERWSDENRLLEGRLAANRELVIEAAVLLEMTEEIMPDFSTLGLFQAVIPGALEARVRSRCSDLIKDIEGGHRPKTVFLATGERVLQDGEAPLLLGEARTEAKMFEAVWATICKENSLHVPTHIVYAPKKAGQTRATTEDTAEALSSNFSLNRKETVVIYIEQPFASRFFPIFATALQNKAINVILRAAPADLVSTPLFTYQDELARRVFFQYPRLDLEYTAKLHPTSSQVKTLSL